MLFEAGAAGASRPKSLYPSRLSPKVYALRTKIDPPLESKIGYNMGMETKDIWGTPRTDNPAIIEWSVSTKRGMATLQLVSTMEHFRIVRKGIIQDAYYPTNHYSLDRMLCILRA